MNASTDVRPATRFLRGILSAAAVMAATFLIAPSAQAAAGLPAWSIASLATPTDFSVADNGAACLQHGGVLTEDSCDSYVVTVTDSGSAPMKAQPVTIEDTLPAGLVVRYVSLFWLGQETVPGPYEENLNEAGTVCSAVAPHLVCTLPKAFFQGLGHTLQPDDSLTMVVTVTVEGSPPSGTLTNVARVAGGETTAAPGAETSSTNTLESGSPPFGPALFTIPTLGPEGEPATQAGSHPYELPTRIGFATEVREEASSRVKANSVEDPRDILVDLPPGLAGSAVSTPRLCTFAELSSLGPAGLQATSGCPAESVIGHIDTYPNTNGNVKADLYDMVPEQGVAAEFGYIDVLGGAHVLYVSLVPTPQGYVLRTSSDEIPQVNLTEIVADVYGDPYTRDGSAVTPKVPTLTMPADCSGEPLITQVHMDSWQHPGTWDAAGEPDLGEPDWVTDTYESPPVSGCDQLEGLFAPTITATPSTDRADSPTGLEVDLRVPQTEGTETLGTPPLRKAVVTLPEGMTVNPSSANGLVGCSLAQIGVSASGRPDAAAPRCPDASKIGTVELQTPALPGTLEGQIFVARQSENPFDSLLAIYIAINDPKTGVVVKLPGEVKADPTTGQLETVVDDSPQFPFSELRTHFFGGQRAALRTPSVCGKYTVTSQLTPWSAPESGPPATPSASFEITQGCASSAAGEPDRPSFTAGTVNPLAGAYSPFVLKLSREDGSQELDGLGLTLPEGLIGRLAGIPYCPDADLAAVASKTGAQEKESPSCPAASEVGTVTIGAGAGLEPYYATGHAYLAGPYKGAPLSLAIITPAVAGPYDLGDVLVRNALQVNPYTARITAVSDPIPHILQGIPLDIRSITLEMARPQFTLNPTSCEKKSITGSVSTVLGQSAALTNPFQVGGCKNLAFKPKLALSLEGSTRRAGHPALKATLTYPPGSGYANVAYAQVGLPGTEFLDQGNLNHVCTQAELASATCPASSVYGTAKAWTPLLEKPLEGKVYLGVGFGYKLPALVAELGGQIRVLLAGKVDTDPEKGIRGTFEVVPDAPVSKFVLEMKGGPKYGLLENTSGVCAKPQKAAVKFIAQNGKVEQYRQAIVNGCGRALKGGKGKKGSKGKKHKSHTKGAGNR